MPPVIPLKSMFGAHVVPLAVRSSKSKTDAQCRCADKICSLDKAAHWSYIKAVDYNHPEQRYNLMGPRLPHECAMLLLQFAKPMLDVSCMCVSFNNNTHTRFRTEAKCKQGRWQWTTVEEDGDHSDAGSDNEEGGSKRPGQSVEEHRWLGRKMRAKMKDVFIKPSC